MYIVLGLLSNIMMIASTVMLRIIQLRDFNSKSDKDNYNDSIQLKSYKRSLTKENLSIINTIKGKEEF